MLNVRTGSAAVSRVAQKNPMEILISLIEDDPTADADRLFSHWSHIIRDDEDLLTPALRHTFTNMLSCLDRDRRRSRQRPTIAASQNVAEREAMKEQAKTVIVQTILMNLALPDGKLLRDAKFKDCAKAGGWFSRIAKMGKPDAVVGRTLSEEDLRKVPL